jgi:hypothetical protein
MSAPIMIREKKPHFLPVLVYILLSDKMGRFCSFRFCRRSDASCAAESVVIPPADRPQDFPSFFLTFPLFVLSYSLTNSLMEAYQAKLVAAATGSTLTALTSKPHGL